MNRNLVTAVIGATLAFSPMAFAQQSRDDQKKVSQPKRESDDGVQAAIAYQRAKDRADARQAKVEERHPSVDYSNADRRMDDSNDGRHVPDPGPKKDKK